MAILSEKFDIPYDREAVLFSEDEDHAALEEYFSNFIRRLRQIIFEITDVVNINVMPPAATKTGDYTLTQDDRVIITDATAGPITLTLPKAVFSPSRQFDIKKIDITANIVTIDPDGSETIDGDPTMTLLSKDETVRIYCDGTEWFIL
jgi:hypothetical protein